MGNYDDGTRPNESEEEKPFAPPKEVTVRESNTGVLKPVNITKLTGSAAANWSWEGYVSPGSVTLMTGMWKAGKTTLLGHLFRQFADGGELGTPVHKSKVLILTEESCGKWADRRDAIKIGDNVDVQCRPFLQRPTHEAWAKYIEKLSCLVTVKKYRCRF